VGNTPDVPMPRDPLNGMIRVAEKLTDD